jgi:hypothetical protein
MKLIIVKALIQKLVKGASSSPYSIFLLMPKAGPRAPGRIVKLFLSNNQPFDSSKYAMATLPSLASTLRRLEVMPKMVAASLAEMILLFKKLGKVMRLLYYERGGIVIFRA